MVFKYASLLACLETIFKPTSCGQGHNTGRKAYYIHGINYCIDLFLYVESAYSDLSDEDVFDGSIGVFRSTLQLESTSIDNGDGGT
ncbi:unnamed protein product [Fusarium graminearum]|nr:unnamed protein product [Fusarium graminearum]CAF3654112.1 unnamed protein product [Fusarium graminearum]CAG2000347.1 unnamed protein product [Fusarium graminearum]